MGFRSTQIYRFFALLLAGLLAAGCAAGGSPSPTAPVAPTLQMTATPPQVTATIAPATQTTTAPAAPATGAAPIPGASAPVSGTDWTTYHRDNARTGYIPSLPDPQSLAVAWNTRLDGAVYAEPLVVGGHVLVATEGDTVYSLNGETGAVEWRTNLGAPVPRSALPCGNINPLGITGTPVYDPAGGLVFVVAEVTGPAHILAGLDAKTGEVRVRRTVDPQGMTAVAQQQRAALTLSQGMVYVAFGGLFGDCGNYHGWVVGSKTDGSGALVDYKVPTEREGGIWAPPGPVLDSAGRLFVSVGNGSETLGDWDRSDSVLRLSAALKLEDGFAPDRWRQDNLTDADLGSLGPVLLPDGLVLIAGKSGIGYLLRADRLGGVGGQLVSQPICHAYGGAAVVGATAFVPCNEGVQQVTIGPGPTLTLGWLAKQVPGSPVVGGKTLYTLDRNGTLHAIDIGNGQTRASVNVGATTRFATPTLSGNRVFVGTTTGVTAVTAQ